MRGKTVSEKYSINTASRRGTFGAATPAQPKHIENRSVAIVIALTLVRAL